MLYEVIKTLKTEIFVLFRALNKEDLARGLQFRGAVLSVDSSSTSTFRQY